MGSIRITTATSAQEVDSIRSAWEHLIPADQPRSIFVDPDRILSLSGTLARTPHVVSFNLDDRPIALLVGETGLRRTSIRLGYKRIRSPMLRVLDVHYGGVLTDGTPMAQAALTDELIRLSGSSEFDLIAFNHLPVKHPLFSCLNHHHGLRRRMTVFDPEPHHWMQLVPGSAEQTLNAFSKKHRYNLRRADRTLNEHVGGKLALRSFTMSADVDEFIKGSAAIADRSYQSALGVGFCDSDVWRTLLESEASLHRMRCYWLTVGEKPIAFHAGVIHGSSYALEATAYLPEFAQWSPGTVLLLRVIEDLCIAGVKDIDYGFGDADYKRNHSTITCEESSIHIHSTGSKYAWLAPLERAGLFSERQLRRLVGRLGLTARIRKYWRNRRASRSRPMSENESVGVKAVSSRE